MKTAKVLIYRKATELENWTKVFLLVQEFSFYRPSGVNINLSTEAPHRYISLTVSYSNLDIKYLCRKLRKLKGLNLRVKIYRPANNELTVEKIQQTVCDYFKVPTEMLQSKTRKREIVQARQISMSFSRFKTKQSLAIIGTLHGGKDHATVLHACRTVSNLQDTDKKYKFQLEEISKLLEK